MRERFVANSLLALQRTVSRLPAPLRRTARLFRSSTLGRTDIADWSRPLVGGGVIPADSFPAEVRSELTGGPVTPVTGSGALRCLFVTDTLDVGGTDDVVAYLAARLPDHGICTAVLHVPENPRLPSGVAEATLRAAGIEIIQATAPSSREWLRHWLPDVLAVHTCRPYDPEPWWPLRLAAESGIPIVQTLHGTHALYDTPPSVLRRHAELVTLFVAVSDLLRGQYLRVDPDYPSERIVVIPNAVRERPRVDRDWARHMLGLTDEYLFVCLARHCLQKNTYGLVRAFRHVAGHCPDAHLVIAGRLDDPAYYAQAAALAESAPYKGRVHLRSHFAQPAVLLAAADGFVLDSFFEGWSLASMDALAAGLPLVLADVGGAREQLEDAPSPGYLVPNPLGDALNVTWEAIARARFTRQANEDALVQAMTSLVEKRHDWLQQREWIARRARERFSPELWVARHAAVLRAAVENSAIEWPSM